jgi:mono/diheme cytochrome c family protein
MKTLVALSVIFFTLFSHAQDWSREAQLPGPEGRYTPLHRANIFSASESEQAVLVEEGRRHAFHYPVEVSELNIPYRVMKNYFEAPPSDPLKKWIFQITQQVSDLKSVDDVMDWVGIHDFPQNDDERGPGPWPVVANEEMRLGMGATLFDVNGAEGLTFSCAACHSADLFGKKVVGLTNRFPRANEFFVMGKRLLPLAHPDIFRKVADATEAEVELLKKARYAVQFVGVKKPQVLGLDTSLAQVAMSLARRGKDEYAERTAFTANFPRSNPLDKKIADSKPAVWWNVKYKTRWLSDGSIVQGNPIHTNFLWNEIGRGVDLHALEKWLTDNQPVIDELTAAVFATEAPHYLDFLPADTFNEALAREGQPIFKAHCAGCHGDYKKAWEGPLADTLSVKERVKTTEVWYHKKTPVIDVGTDPGRHEGMQYFAKALNDLKISRSIKTIVEPQKGYVPPPLVGIWARWPYFHNNSAPNLCAVLTRASARPKTYVAGPAVDPRTDYDADCGGYPLGDKAPPAWKKDKDYLYNTRLEGLSNSGHDEGVFLKNGVELMSPTEKRALIEFLKTL